MIELRELTKRYGDKTAVHDLTLTVEPGKITGFLGPNGAGKSTTMRMILGLDRPTSGTALIDGRPYAAFPHPLREVGALLDAKALHPGRSARAHLVALARSNGIPTARVDEALETVGLAAVARRRAGTFSLGMGQRLGIAGALLGDPRVLLFDEPVNGLDPDGVLWVRRLMRTLAAEGRTVFVSSHLMSEMELTADRLVVIGKGRLIADAPVAEVIARSSRNAVRLRSPRADLLPPHLPDADIRRTGPDTLTISGVPIERLGMLCHELGVPVLELSPQAASLEEAYMELTGGSVEYGVRGKADAR
ncbi:ABC transporter ATP-binding protein [Actinomadura hibisca]|uniref:ABC transporter ATP-binding protein n=1 Tax=Actinomadura hibisca TaxID=68565 RepID=UPI00082AA105|nr:ABC transporter ATP-binding protein [Actinomadura hibisca]